MCAKQSTVDFYFGFFFVAFILNCLLIPHRIYGHLFIYIVSECKMHVVLHIFRYALQIARTFSSISCAHISGLQMFVLYFSSFSCKIVLHSIKYADAPIKYFVCTHTTQMWNTACTRTRSCFHMRVCSFRPLRFFFNLLLNALCFSC